MLAKEPVQRFKQAETARLRSHGADSSRRTPHAVALAIAVLAGCSSGGSNAANDSGGGGSGAVATSGSAGGGGGGNNRTRGPGTSGEGGGTGARHPTGEPAPPH